MSTVKTIQVSKLPESTSAKDNDLLAISKIQEDGTFISNKIKVSNLIKKTNNVVSVYSNYTPTSSDDILMCQGTLNISLYSATGSGKLITINNKGNGRVFVYPYTGQTLRKSSKKVSINETHSITILDSEDGNWDIQYSNL